MPHLSPRLCMCVLLALAIPARAEPLDDGAASNRVSALEAQLATLQARVAELEARTAPLADPAALQMTWREGLTFRSADRAFNLQLGGRVQTDAAFFTDADPALEEKVGPLEDGVGFRRARLELGGTIYERAEFKAQYDFADGTAGFRYVYAGLNEVPLAGTLRVGHMQEPFGLEQLTSSKYMTFLERGLTTAFAPSYNTGVMNLRPLLDQRATVSVGVFRDTDNFGKASSDGGYHTTGRATVLPIDAAEGRRLLHLGVAGSYQTTADGETRYRSRPEAQLAPYFVDTETIAADDIRLLGLEAAAVRGAWSLQSEYMHIDTRADAAGAPDFAFDAWYVQLSVFLTGEHRPYDRKNGFFSRVRPKRDFTGRARGPGAWEIALRASEIDLDDGPVAGGTLRDATVALNWYLNPNMRVMLNAIRADLDDVGEMTALTTRVQVDF